MIYGDLLIFVVVDFSGYYWRFVAIFCCDFFRIANYCLPDNSALTIYTSWIFEQLILQIFTHELLPWIVWLIYFKQQKGV